MYSKKSSSADKLTIIEDRFKVVCGLGGNLSKYPLSFDDDVQFDTDKEKSRVFAEVFTPLHIVDQMLDTIPQMSMTTNNLDLCSGCGQFSIRILRKLYEVHGEKLDIGSYLKKHHYFSELQISSCFKLMWIFSSDINLFIGDSLQLGKLSEGSKGIWYYLEDLGEWICITSLVKTIYSSLFGVRAKTWIKGKLFVYEDTKEELFVKVFESIMSSLNKNSKGYKVYIKQVVRTKEGRQALMEMVSKAASGVELNWQTHATPEWVVREMVNTVPDVTSLKKILVLFNIEFLECLVKEKGIDPSCIDFGYDSDIEGKLASAVYRVGTFSIDHCMEVLKTTTFEASGKRGGYDVIFSNPPYQIQSENQKGRKGSGSKQAKPIYHEIVMYAIDSLSPQYLCMITPSRWMVGGMGLSKYRARMLADKHIKVIQDFPGAFDVFPTVKIESGVSYFLWDKSHNGLCEFNGTIRDLNEFDVLVRDNTSCQILRKVMAKASLFCNGKVFPNKPFGLATNFNDWVSEGTTGAVKCMSKGKKIKWVYPNAYTDTNNIKGFWKVCTPAAYGEDTSENSLKYIIKGTHILNQNSVCTETYIVIGAFTSKKEAENYLRYSNTKFFRFITGIRKATQHLNTEKFSWVPDLGNYNHAYTDEELYAHFGLTKKEIEHIEKSIKAIK